MAFRPSITGELPRNHEKGGFDIMIRLLIIADDFTGALDTGVKFSAAGASTKIITDVHTNFTGDGPEVLVLCVPTRHLSSPGGL